MASVTTDVHGPLLPMVTVCNIAPIRCSCSAFYDPRLLASPAWTSVIPYICGSALVMKNTTWEPVDAKGNAKSYDILEDAIKYVDLELTKAQMLAYPASSKLSCATANYTDDAIVERIITNSLRAQDLYGYAGYSDRTRILRGCMAVDTNPSSATAGQKVSCADDTWWSAPTYDPAYGACHTFNPCHGFPVGDNCKTDADCAHDSDSLRAGGRSPHPHRHPTPARVRVEGRERGVNPAPAPAITAPLPPCVWLSVPCL